MRNGSATGLTEREDRGNAILSTEPLTDVRAIELPFGKQRRVAVTALIASRGDRPPIRVVSTHFDTNGDRVAQATALSERLMLFTDAPLLVGGDLNSRRGRTTTRCSRLPIASRWRPVEQAARIGGRCVSTCSFRLAVSISCSRGRQQRISCAAAKR